MISNTFNSCDFYSPAEIQCEYEITTIIGESEKTIPKYETFYQNKHNTDSCRGQHQHVKKEAIVAVNSKRLGLSWQRHNMQRRKNCLMRNICIQKENANTCSLGDQPSVFTTPRIPIASLSTQHSCEGQYCIQYFDYSFSVLNSFSNSNFRPLSNDSDVHNAAKPESVNIAIFEAATDNEKDKENTYNLEAVNKEDREDENKFLCAKRLKRSHHKHRTRSYYSILCHAWLLMVCSYLQQQNRNILQLLFIIFLTLTQYFSAANGLLVSSKLSPAAAIGLDFTPLDFEKSSDLLVYNSTSSPISRNSSSINHNNSLAKTSFSLVEKNGNRETYLPSSKSLIITSSTEVGGSAGGAYLEKLDNLERSLAAVLIKVAYGTTSTTKRSIPENSYVPSLTTIATPILTTLR